MTLGNTSTRVWGGPICVKLSRFSVQGAHTHLHGDQQNNELLLIPKTLQRRGLFHGKYAFHVGVEDAVVLVGPGCGGSCEGGGAGFNGEVERGGRVGGKAVGFDVLVSDGDGGSGADGLGVLILEAFDQDYSGDCRRGALIG